MTRRTQAGFTLIDILVVIMVFSIVAAMAVPMIQDVSASIRLGQGLREVERELQTARLKAVTANRPMRIRFNCPVAGQYRMVELIGSPAVPNAADSAANRCSEAIFPFPPADTNPLTRPNHDGPLRRLPPGVAFGAATALEFRPDGTVRQQSGTTNPWPAVATSGTAVTLTKDNVVRTITVNGLGKIQLVR